MARAARRAQAQAAHYSKSVDFDGNFTLNWQGHGGETGYEVERSTDGTNYQTVASLGADQNSVAFTDQPNGEISFRVRALTPGQIGSYVTAPSNVANVIVDRRGKVDITSQVATAMSNVSFTGGVFKMDLNMKNNSTSSYVPLVELNIIGITSASGTVSVQNADNGGNGKSASSAALFGYSNLLGADQEFNPAETTGTAAFNSTTRRRRCLVSTVAVTAYQRGAGGGGAGAAVAGGGEASGGSSPWYIAAITDQSDAHHGESFDEVGYGSAALVGVNSLAEKKRVRA